MRDSGARGSRARMLFWRATHFCFCHRPSAQGALMKSALSLMLAVVLSSLVVAQTTNPNLQQLDGMAARCAPAPIRADVSGLNQGDREALPKIIQAARIL